MKNVLMAGIYLSCVLLLLSCASAPKITRITSLVPLSDADKKITKSGVTIEVTPVNNTNLAQYPMLSVQANVLTKGFLEKEPTPKAVIFPNVLPGLTFALKVTNNTGHIIKMADSEIGLAVGGKDVNKLSIEGMLQVWSTYLRKEYPYQPSVPIEVLNAVTNVPYWNESLKILPGKTITGFATFDVALTEGVGNATMSIYDLVTNTDQAGNPTERTSFDFNLKELTTTIEAK